MLHVLARKFVGSVFTWRKSGRLGDRVRPFAFDLGQLS